MPLFFGGGHSIPAHAARGTCRPPRPALLGLRPAVLAQSPPLGGCRPPRPMGAAPPPLGFAGGRRKAARRRIWRSGYPGARPPKKTLYGAFPPACAPISGFRRCLGAPTLYRPERRERPPRQQDPHVSRAPPAARPARCPQTQSGCGHASGSPYKALGAIFKVWQGGNTNRIQIARPRAS